MSLVYALVARSNPNEIRYIGKTEDKTPNKRLYSHIWESRDLSNRIYKCNWIRKVLSEGDEVLAIVVETCLSFNESNLREIYYISHYRQLGHRLTNLTDGGEGALGYSRTHSEATRQKIRDAATGRVPSKATRAKISEAKTGHKYNVGRIHTEKSRANMRDAQRYRPPTSEVTRAKISDSLKGHIPTEEARKNMSNAAKARKRKKTSSLLEVFE